MSIRPRTSPTARTVAVKVLREEFCDNEEFLRRFKNESKAIAMLSPSKYHQGL